MRPARIPVCPSPGDCPGYYLPANLPPDHPLAAQWVPCACTLARQAARIKATLPQKYQAMTFEAFQVEDGNREAFELARRFAANPWGQGWYWLVLIGANGRGKTHLAAAVTNVLLDRGEPVCFEVVPELLDYLREGYGQSGVGDDFDKRFARVKDATVLVLDDLGAQSQGRADTPYAVTWAEDKLYQLFDYRLVNERPTVVTTNIPLNGLPPRLASRLQDRQAARVKALTTGDRRKQA
jgi:DNA replication protein DnaC